MCQGDGVGTKRGLFAGPVVAFDNFKRKSDMEYIRHSAKLWHGGVWDLTYLVQNNLLFLDFLALFFQLGWYVIEEIGIGLRKGGSIGVTELLGYVFDSFP